VRIASGGLTDVGRVRTNNEDCFQIVKPLELYVLSDGMGGEAHGEVASAMAVETVVRHCLEAEANPAAPFFGQPQRNWSDRTKRLSSAVYLANREIFESAKQNTERRGMGATLTAAWIDGSKLSIAHVGDSRAYLLRGGALQQLTNDHSLVAEQVRKGILTPAEAEQSEMQSVLTRALGSQAQVEIDAEELGLFKGDLVLLCSDGLTRMVTEPEIAGTLQAETDPARAAAKLVALANENGGADNVTVLVIRLESGFGDWFSRLRRVRKHANGNGSTGGN
jgi:serine/threonine protein phosphatase PrpC